MHTTATTRKVAVLVLTALMIALTLFVGASAFRAVCVDKY
jgi:hypothetical protein